MQSDLRSMRIETAHRYTTGRNVTIVVIDTGADDHHPELLGRVTSTASFVPTSPETATDIHGTAVAGIIAAAAGNGRGIVGIAPSAHLRVMKACWQRGARRPEAVCNTFTLALALNTAIDEKPQIINMSLNGPADPLLQRLIAKALSEGIIVVASEADIPGPDNEFPASIAGVIAVRTAADAELSPPNGKHSIPAPGTEILTTVPNDRYGFMSGSSFAAAHVAGLIALFLELNPRLNREQIGSILRASTVHTGNDRMHGTRLDACNGIANLIHPPNACSPEGDLHQAADVRPAEF
jgi:subtilisin family serine protease